MIVYIVRRFVNYLILTLLATVIGYFLASLVLNPAARFYGRHPRPSNATIEKGLQGLGVDPHRPVVARTWDWMSNIFLHGTFGQEINHDSVGHDMLVRSGVSLQLLLIGSILGAILGVALGVWGAVRQYRASDQVVTYASYVVLATPVFVIGVLLMILATDFNNAVGKQLIQFTGQYTPGLSGTWHILVDRLSHLLLPTIALAALGAAEYSRYQRNAMLDVLSADYIRTARSKGRRRGSALRAARGARRPDPDVDVLRLQLRDADRRVHVPRADLQLARHGRARADLHHPERRQRHRGLDLLPLDPGADLLHPR